MSKSKKTSDRQSLTLQFGGKSDEDRPVEIHVLPPQKDEDDQPPGDEFVFFNPVFAMRDLRSRPSTTTAPKRAPKPTNAPPASIALEASPSPAKPDSDTPFVAPTLTSEVSNPAAPKPAAENPKIPAPKWPPDVPKVTPLTAPPVGLKPPTSDPKPLPNKKINEFGFVLPPEYKKKKGAGGSAYVMLAAGVLLAVGGIGGAWVTLNNDADQVAGDATTPVEAAEPEPKVAQSAPGSNADIETAQADIPKRSPELLSEPTLDSGQISIPVRPPPVAPQKQAALAAPSQTVPPSPAGRTGGSATQMAQNTPGPIARAPTTTLPDTIGLPSRRTAGLLAKPSFSDMPDVLAFAAPTSDQNMVEDAGSQQVSTPVEPELPVQLPTPVPEAPSFRLTETLQSADHNPLAPSLDDVALQPPSAEHSDDHPFQLALADDGLSGIRRAQENADLGALQNYATVDSDVSATPPSSPVIIVQTDTDWASPSTLELVAPTLPALAAPTETRPSDAPILVIAAAQIPFQSQNGVGDQMQYTSDALGAPISPRAPRLSLIPGSAELAKVGTWADAIETKDADVLAKPTIPKAGPKLDAHPAQQDVNPTLIAIRPTESPQLDALEATFSQSVPFEASAQVSVLAAANLPDTIPQTWLSMDRLAVWQSPLEAPSQQDVAFSDPSDLRLPQAVEHRALGAPGIVRQATRVFASEQDTQRVQIDILPTDTLIAPGDPDFGVAGTGPISTPSAPQELAVHPAADPVPNISGLKRDPAETQIAAYQPEQALDASEALSAGVSPLDDSGPNRVLPNSPPQGETGVQLALSRFKSAPITRNQVGITRQPLVPGQSAWARPPVTTATISTPVQNLAKPQLPAASLDATPSTTNSAPRAIAFISATEIDSAKEISATETLAPYVTRATWSVDGILTLADVNNAVRIEQVSASAPEWATEGAVIRALDGKPVGSQSGWSAMIAANAVDAVKGKIAVELGVENAQGEIESHVAKLPIRRTLDLGDGTQLSIQQSRKKWKTTVLAVGNSNTDLQTGDVLLFDFITKEKLTTPTAIDTMLTSLRDQNVAEVTIAIVRDGVIENAIFRLPPAT